MLIFFIMYLHFDSRVIYELIECRWGTTPVYSRIISEKKATKNARFPQWETGAPRTVIIMLNHMER